MGYYTDYALDIKVDHTKYNALEILGAFREEYEDAAFALNEDGGISGDDAKWYDAPCHLRDFSEKYPDVLFTLFGNGEEPLDVWFLYVMNGKYQCAPAEFAEFDPAKLEYNENEKFAEFDPAKLEYDENEAEPPSLFVLHYDIALYMMDLWRTMIWAIKENWKRRNGQERDI